MSSYDFLVRQNFAALIFDWDGVVVDSAADYYRAYELTLRPRGILTTPREVYLVEGMTTEQVMTKVYADRGQRIFENEARELARVRREIYSEIARNELFPGVWELITELHQAGYELGLVTGSTRGTMQLALPPEREKYFNTVVTGDTVTRPKPDPEPFQIALGQLKLPPERCVVVENAPFGIESAHRAGCRVVALCTTLDAGDLAAADWVVQGHPDLRELLNSSAGIAAPTKL